MPKYINKNGDANIVYADDAAWLGRPMNFVDFEMVENSFYRVWWGTSIRAKGELRFDVNINGFNKAEHAFHQKCKEIFAPDKFQLKRENNLERERKRLLKTKEGLEFQRLQVKLKKYLVV
jgi:hypothetical protein